MSEGGRSRKNALPAAITGSSSGRPQQHADRGHHAGKPTRRGPFAEQRGLVGAFDLTISILHDPSPIAEKNEQRPVAFHPLEQCAKKMDAGFRR
jgi:hypothetical protein